MLDILSDISSRFVRIYIFLSKDIEFKFYLIKREEPRDWILKTASLPAWMGFMRQYLEYGVQGEIADASIRGEELDERSALDKFFKESIRYLYWK
jgi:hypothetical protein